MKGIWPAGVNSGSLSCVRNARTRIIEPHATMSEFPLLGRSSSFLSFFPSLARAEGVGFRCALVHPSGGGNFRFLSTGFNHSCSYGMSTQKGRGTYGKEDGYVW